MHISFGIYYDPPTKICSQFWVLRVYAPRVPPAGTGRNSKRASLHADMKSRVNTENRSNAAQKIVYYSEMDPVNCGEVQNFNQKQNGELTIIGLFFFLPELIDD